VREIRFLLAVWKTNLLSAMEYRVAFISQIIGMLLNDFIYFAIWIIFFERFKEVRGWVLSDMYITYGLYVYHLWRAGKRIRPSGHVVW
jgi:ABC-2 type transport system permease protein